MRARVPLFRLYFCKHFQRQKHLPRLHVLLHRSILLRCVHFTRLLNLRIVELPIPKYCGCNFSLYHTRLIVFGYAITLVFVCVCFADAYFSCALLVQPLCNCKRFGIGISVATLTQQGLPCCAFNSVPNARQVMQHCFCLFHVLCFFGCFNLPAYNFHKVIRITFTKPFT